MNSQKARHVAHDMTEFNTPSSPLCGVVELAAMSAGPRELTSAEESLHSRTAHLRR